MTKYIEHPEAERADPYEKDVERVWRDSGKVYGARKIRHALGHEGVTLSRRRINRIMKGNGMAGSCSKAAYRPRPARPDDDPAPNILAREFNGHAPRTHLASCVCSIESGPCERVDVFHVSGRFWSTSACGEKRTPARPAWTSFPS